MPLNKLILEEDKTQINSSRAEDGDNDKKIVPVTIKSENVYVKMENENLKIRPIAMMIKNLSP